ncbi:hypothetical protein MCHUDSM44219_03510 [Mycolicibacterium chubuense]|uniref:Uncharacterized protein n=1 Tax=Mycolicibacterium chubuense TaxID=1800 RepID=A0A0J6W278_MYCCU|nr:hypothetical protein MCHUDSM44219_03510 [Mycolicibacterium chubuense]
MAAGVAAPPVPAATGTVSRGALIGAPVPAAGNPTPGIVSITSGSNGTSTGGRVPTGPLPRRGGPPGRGTPTGRSLPPPALDGLGAPGGSGSSSGHGQPCPQSLPPSLQHGRVGSSASSDFGSRSVFSWSGGSALSRSGSSAAGAAGSASGCASAPVARAGASALSSAPPVAPAPVAPAESAGSAYAVGVPVPPAQTPPATRQAAAAVRAREPTSSPPLQGSGIENARDCVDSCTGRSLLTAVIPPVPGHTRAAAFPER